MKDLYALVTNQCDLSCPHCDIKSTQVDDYNADKFLNTIRDFDGNVIIFGGEPTLHKDRLLEILSLHKASSISTNLVNLDPEIIPYIKNLNIATSWNKSRFTESQYQQWLDNLKVLNGNKIGCMVMITLTDDLINADIDEFIAMIIEWDLCFPAIESILFEQLVDSNKPKEFYSQVDEWLCQVYNKWDEFGIGIKNIIVDKLNQWHCDCSGVYTLHPNGSITNGCPHASGIQFANECLSCNYSDNCIPCRLQRHCTYPKKLAQLVKG